MMVLMMNWRSEASCRGMDIDLFFPKQAEYARGRKVCKDCSVQRECLGDTLWRDNDNYGLFGGLTPSERHELRTMMIAQGRYGQKP